MTFTGIFIAMLALGVISPLGVQGADQSTDDNGQAVDFQSQMVSDFTADNTVKHPGAVSGFRFSFVIAEDLVANQDTITVHFDKDFKGHGTSLSRDHVTVFASHASDATTGDSVIIPQTGAYYPNTDATLDRLGIAHPVHHANAVPSPLSNSAVLNNVEYTFYVPDMNGAKGGAPGIAAGATVTLVISPAAGITNPTASGPARPLGVYTNKQPYLVYGRAPVPIVIALSDHAANRGRVITVSGRGFQNGATATIYLDNDCDIDIDMDHGTELVSVPVANDGTVQATFTVTVPPFVPGKGNIIYAEDGNEPPNVSNRLDFEVEGLLTISPSSAAVGDEVAITLVDWPDGLIPSNAVTIAGVSQKIIGTPYVFEHSATFRIEINAGTPSGAHEIRVTANGESDVKRVIIEDRLPTIVFADMNWESVLLQNRIARYIVRNGYGHPTEFAFGATLPLFQALRAGDVHVAMEIWLPNRSLGWEDALEAGEVLSLGTSLVNEWQSAFVIPSYLQEQYPELDSVEDLKEQQYQALFATAETGGKARLVSCAIGWACERNNAAQIEGYGLSGHVQIVNPGDLDALNADLYGAYERQEPWLGYQWGTNTPALLLDLVRLEEPEYSDGCWRTTKACAYPDITVLIGVNSRLPGKAPGVVEFLRQWDFDIDVHLRNVTRWQHSNSGASIEDAALYWLINNVDTWSGWVTDEAANSILAALDRDPLVARYDANGNGTIEKSEVIKAINDYLFGTGDPITKEQVIALINLYLFG